MPITKREAARVLADAHFRIEDVWYLSVVTVTLQAATSLFLVLREFRRKFGDAAGTVIGEIVEI